MKLSELKGEAALDALADMIEPITEVASDVQFVKSIRSGDRIKAVELAIRNHKKAIIQILAASEGKKPEEYEVSILTLPKKLVEVFNDSEVMSLFPSQGTVTSSGPVTESIEGEEK